MAIAGVGIGRIADDHVRDPIARGELVEILADNTVSDFGDIHALYRAAQLMPAACGPSSISRCRARRNFSPRTRRQKPRP
ncbi:hypothetical protein [Rhizobium sp. YTU87027]|uniref:hypothetical protein n=1 Tax=Rhizobium sp. YTU87027 TaxID=3417741 RepID=UPI003D695AF4